MLKKKRASLSLFCSCFLPSWTWLQFTQCACMSVSRLRNDNEGKWKRKEARPWLDCSARPPPPTVLLLPHWARQLPLGRKEQSAAGDLASGKTNKWIFKACVQICRDICICFSSSNAMIFKIMGHDMNCVSICQHFKDWNKKKIINREHLMWWG